MASKRKRYQPSFTAVEALQELMTDKDSDDGDLYGDSDDDDDDGEELFSRMMREGMEQNDSLIENDAETNIGAGSRSRSRSPSDSGDSDSHPGPVPVPVVQIGRGRGRARGRGRGGTFARGAPAQRRGRGRGTCRAVPNRALINDWNEAGPDPPNNIPFTGQPGIQPDTTNFSPVDYLQLYFDDDIMNHLVIQTNLYAQQFKEAHTILPGFSRVHTWVDITPDELKSFLGLILLMGIVKLPSIELYWSTKIVYRVPIFSLIMTRNRFQIILKFIHFHDNANLPAPGSPNYDRLYKIRPILDHLFQKFQEVYEPRKNVCVDESLLLWKGRLLFRQYIPLKRARFGIKIYMCCESDGGVRGSGGYCYRFKIYAGREDPVNEIRDVLPADALHLSTSEKMVVYLMVPLLDKGYAVYTDNWYTSVRLYQYLLRKQTLACGTVRANRGVPVDLQATNPPSGSSVAVTGDGIVATKYHSTKMVYFLSSQHGHRENAVRNRRRNGIQHRPQVSCDYNTNMGGVDKQDQVIQPYDCTRKTMKWTKKVFFHCLQVAACNAFILACKDGYNKPFLQFLESVVVAWLWKEGVMPPSEESEDVVRLKQIHFPAPIPATTKLYPARVCVVCSKKGLKRKETRNHCPDCPSKPALCYPVCYRDYHTKFVYWK